VTFQSVNQQCVSAEPVRGGDQMLQDVAYSDRGEGKIDAAADIRETFVTRCE
jgi:hypothetical protein